MGRNEQAAMCPRRAIVVPTRVADQVTASGSGPWIDPDARDVLLIEGDALFERHVLLVRSDIFNGRGSLTSGRSKRRQALERGDALLDAQSVCTLFGALRCEGAQCDR